MDAELAIVLLMTFNAVVSVGWAWGAFRVALRFPLHWVRLGWRSPRNGRGFPLRSPLYWREPVPWRWLVFFWMGTKACLFVALDVAIAIDISERVALGVVCLFTYSHTWAYLRWRKLPDSVADGPGLADENARLREENAVLRSRLGVALAGKERP
jgi:hypothetical protein